VTCKDIRMASASESMSRCWAYGNGPYDHLGNLNATMVLTVHCCRYSMFDVGLYCTRVDGDP